MVKKKKPFTVNVAGVPYTIHMGTLEEYPILKKNKSCGLCDYSIKSIWVHDARMDKFSLGDMQNQKYLTDITLRHELIHAYLHESGQEDYAEDETLVEFLALSLEKMYGICKDAGAINLCQSVRKAA